MQLARQLAPELPDQRLHQGTRARLLDPGERCSPAIPGLETAPGKVGLQLDPREAVAAAQRAIGFEQRQPDCAAVKLAPLKVEAAGQVTFAPANTSRPGKGGQPQIRVGDSARHQAPLSIHAGHVGIGGKVQLDPAASHCQALLRADHPGEPNGAGKPWPSVGHGQGTKQRGVPRLATGKQELRDEYKDTEGSPQIKARVRQIQMQMARNRMMDAVPLADVVVTNPTHYAVALKYDPDQHQAPNVLAKGQRLIAQKIKEIALEHNIPVVEDVPLARALYKMCDIGQVVPAQLYRAVAEVLAYVYRLKGKAVK